MNEPSLKKEADSGKSRLSCDHPYGRPWKIPFMKNYHNKTGANYLKYCPTVYFIDSEKLPQIPMVCANIDPVRRSLISDSIIKYRYI